ncbi:MULTISPECIES: lysine N(6)-hydroxylase/L-ornithine N(5)-oxygenase family protein [unclassified Streptomyces]|uniref:lysine N(6)-hydroxylase/L-ornithine N(5)-oxygenase family protein n=1 Tax=unclassified Streptomyces TaxID=2593676 RepID=UPI0037FBCB67
MSTRAPEVYDVVGIGFGPSNLSLAISLEEHRENTPANPTTAVFFERQQAFGWHRNMLLPSATMQISFLKDLATFRNPVSRFGYVSYLHESGRLAKFVNNMDFFPTRLEFHQYLEWAAANFTDRVSYGSDVTAIRMPPGLAGERPDYVEVEVRDNATGVTRLVNARNVAISTGLVPRMPQGMKADERVWHSSEFLAKYRRMNPSDLKRVAVVGAGQSAAEITRYLYDSLPHAEVSAIFPSYGYSVADDTPFANQIFDPDAVDDYYYGTEKARESFWRYHKNTNYSVVDGDVIKDLYRRSYDEDVAGVKRLHFLNMTRVREVKRAGDETRVLLDTLLDGHTRELDVDAIVFATGYDSLDPSRLLGDLDRYCLRDDAGRHQVQRDNRLVTLPELPCGLYIQGGTEHTHGLSSALLSNIAIRSGEIADSIVSSRPVAAERGQLVAAMAG